MEWTHSIFDCPKKWNPERTNLIMKKLLLFAAALFCFTLAQAQLTGLEIEEVIVHPSTPYATPNGDLSLEGYTTYRIYATVENTDTLFVDLGDMEVDTILPDYVSAVFGENAQITTVQTEGTMWQSVFGGALAGNINPAFYPADESLIYDSWLTIGQTDQESPSGSVTAIGGNDDDDDFQSTFESTGGFELSGVSGGLWFTLNDEAGLGSPNEDGRILLAQFTTDGCVSGTFWIQCFINGIGTNANIDSFDFSTCGSILGCTDATALNFNAEATTDNNSCLYDCAIFLDGEVNSTGPTCAYLNDGSISLDVTGAQQFTEFSIVGSEEPPLAVGNFTDLGNGTYTVQVADAVCGSEEYPEFPAITFEVELFTEEFVITAEVLQDVSCLGLEDGIVEGTYSGAVAPVMFGLDQDVLSQTDDALFNGVDNGVTIIYGEDANGCVAESDDVVVNSPFGFLITASSTAGATCSYSQDGVIVCDWSGGTGDNGEVTFSIDGVNFQTETFFEMVGAGTYTVTGLDANNCEDTIEVTVDGPEEIGLNQDVIATTCNGDEDGAITFNATGGNGGFLYTWAGGELTATNSYSDLDAGTYTVVVFDDQDCEGTFEVAIPEPDVITFEVNETAILCNGDTNGAIEIVNVAGGTTIDGAYEYAIDGNNYDVNNIFTGLGAGTYDTGVTDANGCEVVSPTELTEPDAIDVTVDNITAEVDGQCDGAIEISVEGGTAPFGYTWTGPNGFSGDTEDITDACDGDYFLNIEDANGCTFEYAGAIEITIGIEELEGGVELTVYPNPSNGQINVVLEGLTGQDVTYTLTDVAGRIIENVELNAANGLYTQVVDITNEADGTYMLNLIVGHSTKTVRLVKH